MKAKEKRFFITIVAMGIFAIVTTAGIAYVVSSSIVQQSRSQDASLPRMHESMMRMDHSIHAAAVTDDKSFILGMVPHHEEAITSSQELLKVATNPEVKRLAQNIISAQQKEIIHMKQWYANWFNKSYQDDGKYKKMMPSLANQSAANAEQLYLHGMIRHHEAAIQMAVAILEKTDRDELKLLGSNIIKTQNEEIQTMKKLLNPQTMMIHSSH